MRRATTTERRMAKAWAGYYRGDTDALGNDDGMGSHWWITDPPHTRGRHRVTLAPTIGPIGQSLAHLDCSSCPKWPYGGVKPEHVLRRITEHHVDMDKAGLLEVGA